ncbi:PAX-interacting protein 1 [Aplysia californica]|uniref:PAX-interacting protein 1 n=1 Tax=Aplysia californica TaxID=6500 RepID=A0ABM1VVW2_APLCA|nr:PAX-interacting protein 1 [Aplysia californica]
MDTPNPNNAESKTEAQDIFKGVTYYIVGDISSKVTQLLDRYGAKRDSYLSEMVSHVIADTMSDDYSEAKELFELPIVASDWVVLSVYCGVQLPKEAFALEGRIFSDIVACPFELSKEDAESLWCMITYHGGKCQLHLDDKVTHLITAASEGNKYVAALDHSEKVKIVTPDWVVDSITKGEREDETLFHPRLIEYPKPEPEPEPEPEPVVPAAPPVVTAAETLPLPEPMDVNLGNQTMGFLPSPVSKQQIGDDRLELARPDTPNAKEALARKITSRIHGKNSSEPTTPERPVPSHSMGSPGAASGVRIPSPVSTMALQLRMDGNNIRNTLRNITNRATPPAPGVQLRASVPTASPKMVPMVGMGMPPQARPPPPEYPFPPRAVAPPQTSQPAPVASHTASSTPAQSQSGPTYYGHDPKENVPSEFCLLGCVFCIIDYHNILGSDEISSWKTVIEQFGGQVETSYCPRITHVLCANRKSDVFKTALKEGKRVVSAFWLNDCLMQKKMSPPWQALHLPLSFNSEKPGFNQMISVTNFDGEERMRLKQMINAIGAKYTGYMTHHNSALICKKPGGMKFEKAKEWRIAVVNVQWLSDLVLGHMDALRLPVHVRYLQVGQGREFYMDLTRVTHLMGGWKSPIKITKETWKKCSPTVISASGQENTCTNGPSPPKRQKVDCSAPAPEVETGGPKVMFTLYPKSQVSKLENIVKMLGGTVVTNPRHCTHLVCPSLARTIKFFVAINCCRHVVTRDWLEDSATQDRFLEESRYALKDERGEAALGCDLSESLRRSSAKPLFQGLTFYISPSTVPPVCELSSIVESAGGTVVKKRPAAKHIAALIDEQGFPKFVVITCLNDLHLCQDLRMRKIPIFNAEFILTGVMRQEVDFNVFRIAAQ